MRTIPSHTLKYKTIEIVHLKGKKKKKENKTTLQSPTIKANSILKKLHPVIRFSSSSIWNPLSIRYVFQFFYGVCRIFSLPLLIHLYTKCIKKTKHIQFPIFSLGTVYHILFLSFITHHFYVLVLNVFNLNFRYHRHD